MNTSTSRLPGQKTSRTLWIKTVLGKIPPIVVLVAAAFAFWRLPHGVAFGSASFRGFAESITINVGPLGGGRIESLEVALGQKVKAGDVVARMNTVPLEARRAGIQAEILEARAAVTADIQEQEAAVTRVEMRMLRTRTNAVSDRAELDQLSAQLQRLEGLAAQRMINVTDAEDRRRDQSALLARLSVYNNASAKGNAGLGRNANPLKDHAAMVDALTAPAREAVKVQEANLRQVEIELEECSVRAPSDGTVGLLVHRKGEIIPAGEPIVTLVTARPGVIIASVPERIASSLNPGDPATMRRRTILAPVLKGRILEVSPEVDEAPVRARPSPGIPVWGRRIAVALDTPAQLVPGEAFHVRF